MTQTTKLPRRSKGAWHTTLRSGFYHSVGALAADATDDAREAHAEVEDACSRMSGWDRLASWQVPYKTKVLIDGEQAEAAGIGDSRIVEYDRAGQGLHSYDLKGCTMAQVIDTDGGLRWVEWMAFDGQFEVWDTDELTWTRKSMLLGDQIARSEAKGYHPGWAYATLELASHPAFRARLRQMYVPHGSGRSSDGKKVGFAIHAGIDNDIKPTYFDPGIPANADEVGVKVREGHTFLPCPNRGLKGGFAITENYGAFEFRAKTYRNARTKEPGDSHGGPPCIVVQWAEPQQKLRNGDKLRPEDDPLWGGFSTRSPLPRCKKPRAASVSGGWAWLSSYVDDLERIAQTITITPEDEAELRARHKELEQELSIALAHRQLPGWAAKVLGEAMTAAARRLHVDEEAEGNVIIEVEEPAITPALYADLAWVMGQGAMPRHMRPAKHRAPARFPQLDALAEALLVAQAQDGLTARQRRVLAMVDAVDEQLVVHVA